MGKIELTFVQKSVAFRHNSLRKIKEKQKEIEAMMSFAFKSGALEVVMTVVLLSTLVAGDSLLRQKRQQGDGETNSTEPPSSQSAAPLLSLGRRTRAIRQQKTHSRTARSA